MYIISSQGSPSCWLCEAECRWEWWVGFCGLCGITTKLKGKLFALGKRLLQSELWIRLQVCFRLRQEQCPFPHPFVVLVSNIHAFLSLDWHTYHREGNSCAGQSAGEKWSFCPASHHCVWVLLHVFAFCFVVSPHKKKLLITNLIKKHTLLLLVLINVDGLLVLIPLLYYHHTIIFGVFC